MFINTEKTMPNLLAMVTFAQVVESGSFTAAAQELGMSTPVVSKRIGALEAELGTRLLHRTTRKLSVTEAGTAFYQHCARIVEEAKMAETVVTNLNESPRGILRITAPISFGSNQIAPAIAEFLDRYPEISVEMILNDRVVDLAEEGFDLAIRQTNTPQPNLVAKRLTTIHKPVCASPDYWQKHGKPKAPEDLMHHNCILYASVPMNNEWDFANEKGKTNIRVSGRFTVNNAQAMVEAASGGLGVIRLTSIIVSREIESGQLIPVLDDYTSLDTDIYFMYLPNRYLSKKTRVFIDFFTEWYRSRNH